MAQDEVRKKHHYHHDGQSEDCPLCLQMMQYSHWPTLREWLYQQLYYVKRGYCPWCNRAIFLGWLPEVMRDHIKNHHGESVLEALKAVGGFEGSA